MSKIIEKNIAEIIIITLLIVVLSSCSSTYSYKSQEVVNTRNHEFGQLGSAKLV